MCSYKHLSISEREMLLTLLIVGCSCRAIAKVLRRAPSTIARELSRNGDSIGYSPNKAQQEADARRSRASQGKAIFNRPWIKREVVHLITEDHWSPDQISHRMKLEGVPIHPSAATIYRAVQKGILDYRDTTGKRQPIQRHLRRKGKRYHRRNIEEKRGKFEIENTIHVRPKAADKKRRIGDWEFDTVEGKKGGACLFTMDDRKRRMVFIRKCSQRKAIYVTAAAINCLGSLPKNKRRTITPDRRKEFDSYKTIDKAVGVNAYFCNPHAPWQKGTNENNNGLIREFIPKYSDIAQISEAEVEKIQNLMNLRPRKYLGYRTPYEVFYNKVLQLT